MAEPIAVRAALQASSLTTRTTQRKATSAGPQNQYLDEECGRDFGVVNHDADVLYPLDGHAFDGKEPDRPSMMGALMPSRYIRSRRSVVATGGHSPWLAVV